LLQIPPLESLISIKDISIDISYKSFLLGFLAFSLLVSIIIGNDFALSSLKVKEDPILRCKGRFLLISFKLFATGSIKNGFHSFTSATLIIFRTLMMFSSTFYYLEFILPGWIRRLLRID